MQAPSRYSVFVVEDDPLLQKIITDLVHLKPELRISGFAADGHTALAKLAAEQFDLLLLDVHLLGRAALDLLRSLPSPPLTIFIAACEQYAVQAFEIGAVDYLVKPISSERWKSAIDRFLAQAVRPVGNAAAVARTAGDGDALTSRNSFLHVSDKSGRHRVSFNDIVYVSSHSKHSVLHTVREDIEVNRLLGNLLQQLPAGRFRRVHRRFVVNMDFAVRLKHLGSGFYEIALKDEDESVLPVGRSFSVDVRGAMGG